MTTKQQLDNVLEKIEQSGIKNLIEELKKIKTDAQSTIRAVDEALRKLGIKTDDSSTVIVNYPNMPYPSIPSQFPQDVPKVTYKVDAHTAPYETETSRVFGPPVETRIYQGSYSSIMEDRFNEKA